MRTIVRGFWGPRPESVDAVADRWLSTVTAIDELLPGVRWQHVSASRPPAAFVPDRVSLLRALRAAQAEEGWSDLVGMGLRLAGTAASGCEIEVSGLAGGAPQYLLQSLVIGLTAPDSRVLPETQLLAALTRVWDPDFGDATDDDILDALEDDAGYSVGDPVIGRLAYLSAGRAALVPDDLTTGHREPVAGGILVEVGMEPAAVARAYRLLRDAGALAPLPRPLDRDVW
ncbi:hypothetical protein [Rhodococcus sp. Q]|uniref:hypothetical protein n=1 Tax=Rhodococcus sp. Q TaxID=2502252 RepID=UPI0010F85932|nr:hypothetical protein [Rhodococcus sp. Q]